MFFHFCDSYSFGSVWAGVEEARGRKTVLSSWFDGCGLELGLDDTVLSQFVQLQVVEGLPRADHSDICS